MTLAHKHYPPSCNASCWGSAPGQVPTLGGIAAAFEWARLIAAAGGGWAGGTTAADVGDCCAPAQATPVCVAAS